MQPYLGFEENKTTQFAGKWRTVENSINLFTIPLQIENAELYLFFHYGIIHFIK